MDDAELRAIYEERLPDAQELCSRLSQRVEDALDGFPHIDRITFRPKAVDSFMGKAAAITQDGRLKYTEPLRQIEDQVAGRVIVFFRDDLSAVTDRLKSEFGPVEAVHKEPAGDAEFGYESDHLVFVIPNHLRPPGWRDDGTSPSTFEMQVRTLFMHAWAEPQHDLGYKPGANVEVTREQKRKLAWIAASSWGADQTLNEVAKELGTVGLR